MKRTFLLGMGLILAACQAGESDGGGSGPGPGTGGAGGEPDPSASGGEAGSDASTGGDAGAVGSGGGEALPEGVLSCAARAGSCELRECTSIQVSGSHVSECSAIEPSTNPPTIGPHYPIWAQFGIYEEPIHPGFLLHSLEHSAVALLYNCELIEARGDSCDALQDELVQFYDNWPTDPLCGDVPHRLMIVPDSNLETAFAAIAWGYYLEGDCFESARVTEFVNAHYGMNYENICNSGIDPVGRCPE